MRIHWTAVVQRLRASTFFVACLAVLAVVGVTWSFSPLVDPVEDLCAPMLVLAGAVLRRVYLGLVVALSVAVLLTVRTYQHRPFGEILAYAAIYVAAAVAGVALRFWWQGVRAERASAERDEEATLMVTGRAAARSALDGVAGTTSIISALHPQFAVLSPRERDVALLAAENLPAREIGRKLFISERTVETHLAKIYDKLHVHSRGELIAGLKRIPDSRRSVRAAKRIVRRQRAPGN